MVLRLVSHRWLGLENLGNFRLSVGRKEIDYLHHDDDDDDDDAQSVSCFKCSNPNVCEAISYTCLVHRERESRETPTINMLI